MVSPSDLLISRLEVHRDRVLTSRDRSQAAVYDQAIALIPDLFSGRGFGEAIAVATTTFQHELSQTNEEIDRVAWQRCITELEQLYIDLS